MNRNVNLGRMKGRPVIDSNGDNVGTVEDVVVDPTSWKVSGFVVTLRREVIQRLGVQKAGLLDQPRVELGSERIQTVGDNVILNIALDVIQESLRRREPLDSPGSPVASPGAYDPVTGPVSGVYEPPPATTGPFDPPRY